MVLDCVVGATLEHLGDLRPLVSVVPVHQVKNPLFLSAPADLLNLGVKVIVPSLSALLADSAWKVLSDQSPLLGPVLVDQVEHHAILLLSPRAFNEAGVQDFLPPVKALHVRPSREFFRYSLPIFTSVFAHCICQMLILDRRYKEFLIYS